MTPESTVAVVPSLPPSALPPADRIAAPSPAVVLTSDQAVAPMVPPGSIVKRLKPPKDSKVYKVAMAYVALKAQGVKLQEISDQLGIPKDTISTYVKRAHKRGWIRPKDLDVEDQTEISLPELVVRNVVELLDDRDKETTLEAAKGIGIFKSHQAVKVDGAVGVGFALKVQVEMPVGIEAASIVKIRPGSVGGTPAIEAEVIGDADV